MKSRISVIIPTYNGWNTLKDCITSILNQSLAPYEIIVVDNASVDGTWENISNYVDSFSRVNSKKVLADNLNFKFKIIRNKKNLGVTGGRNTGIRLADKRTDYLFFFDHDMVADKNMFQNLIKIAEGDSSSGIITPKVYYWEDKKRIWSAGTGINLWTGQVLFRGGKDNGQYEKTEEVQVAPAAMFVKKEVIAKVKFFDNRYFATYEDTDFCFRAKKAGFKIIYEPKAIAYHKISPDPEDEAKRLLSRGYLVGKNRILFMKDFGKSFLIFFLFLPIYCLHYLKLAVEFHNLKGWKDFMRGTIVGLFT